MTTATDTARLGIGPAELREELALLRDLALDYARVERLIEEKAAKIEASDWPFAEDAPAYIAAVEGQVNRALRLCPGGDEHSGVSAHMVEAIQDAIDVLEFAMERDDAR